MKKTLIAAFVLAAVCAGAGAAAYASFAEDTSVSVHSEPAKSRTDYIEMWKTELKRSGQELPAGVDTMSTQAIIDAWATERAKYAQPE
ncbi:hypothetical protein [Streptomyces sp. NPDC001530]|uniref:hypothetical protein n=1 Tax=Streptomyces sp. NPDC001530 TaxID=3364582 RepID=UPI00369F3579